MLTTGIVMPNANQRIARSVTTCGTATSGQTAIVMVMIMAIIALIFTQISVINLNLLSISNERVSGEALHMKAEGYLESAALRYLRDISYTGETVNDGNAVCTVTVSDIGGFNRDFDVVCSEGSRSRHVGMDVTYSAGAFQFSKQEKR